MIFDALTFAITFVIALVLYPFVIRWLRRFKAGQVIQDELPDSHQKKAGTPTGGGNCFQHQIEIVDSQCDVCRSDIARASVGPLFSICWRLVFEQFNFMPGRFEDGE